MSEPGDSKTERPTESDLTLLSMIQQLMHAQLDTLRAVAQSAGGKSEAAFDSIDSAMDRLKNLSDKLEDYVESAKKTYGERR